MITCEISCLVIDSSHNNHSSCGKQPFQLDYLLVGYSLLKEKDLEFGIPLPQSLPVNIDEDDSRVNHQNQRDENTEHHHYSIRFKPRNHAESKPE